MSSESIVDMQLGDHLGFAGIVLGLIGIGVTIMWPTKRPLGIVCLCLAGAVLVLWGVKAYRESHAEPPPKQAAYNLDNVTEAIWFGFRGNSKALSEQFRDINQNSLAPFSGAGSVNTVDNLPREVYDRAWESTFGKMLLCDPAEGIVGSGITVAVSKHPTIAVQIVNSSLKDTPCRVTANLTNAVHGYIPISNVGQHLGYILDLPFRGDAFGLRFNMTGATVKDFTQGDLPQWRSFAIDDPNESIQLELTRKGREWRPIPNFEEILPKRLTLTTDLMVGGPKIVREFELVSQIPRQFARGDDASGTIIWAFTWQRVQYNEEKSDFSGSN